MIVRFSNTIYLILVCFIVKENFMSCNKCDFEADTKYFRKRLWERARKQALRFGGF